MTDETPALGEYTLRRTIDAGRDRVFAAFTQPGLFADWFVVPGHATPADRVAVDPRAGGGVRAVMVSDTDGSEIPFEVDYDEFDPPAGLTMGFSDHTERLRVSLAELEPGRTELEYHATGTPVSFLDEGRAISEDQLDRLAAAVTEER